MNPLKKLIDNIQTKAQSTKSMANSENSLRNIWDIEKVITSV